MRHSTRLHSSPGIAMLELFIVIAIIALAVSIFFVFSYHMLARHRDTARLNDIETIHKALTLYASSRRMYPVVPVRSPITATSTVMQILNADGSLQATPKDPYDPEYYYSYQSDTSGSTFILTFCMETDSLKGYHRGCDNHLTP